jgi:hypothetical protein
VVVNPPLAGTFADVRHPSPLPFGFENALGFALDHPARRVQPSVPMRGAGDIPSAVEAVEQEISQFLDPGRSPVDDRAALEGLRATLARLRSLMAIQPAPGAGRCPHCGSGGPLDEISCQACWEALVPPAPFVDGPP